MNAHGTALVWLHYGLSGIVGLPAVAGILFSGWQLFDSWRHPLPPLPQVDNTDGMTQIITGTARGVGMVMRPLAELGEFAMRGLLLVSVAMVVFSLVLYFTGRGLQGGAGWARLISGVAFGGMTAVGLVACLAGARVWGASVVLIGGYGLWAVASGFELR